ncbi:MAG: hypothetical protein A3E36_02185 [Candidatus Andersenbacteria bacterium RIFCSPHIGHO2_12_FULL_45_11b]|uniref:DUF192 domain-containing protein n=1 Tax=Candidatus Andersenbacteria bacterium RIFCSPHIGHO2_12_FULL_45_11b TaxID=1797282 RepID=A0A1G1XD59_9BACT|nr:MAG: hypothetical protein A3E36_02185 [Candidatus Andersenbacteria bacterium RIFCSPHIGHO2_12_FULL_45_11b]
MKLLSFKIFPVLLAVCAIIAIPVFALVTLQKPVPCGTDHIALLRTPTQTLGVSVAITPQERARGLGGCAMLARKTGMYFPLSAAGVQTFWMKDMLIPIDIVWLSKGKVVGVTANVPPPEPDTKDSLLTTYQNPHQDVDAVLEVGAGNAKAYGLTIGAQVVLVN